MDDFTRTKLWQITLAPQGHDDSEDITRERLRTTYLRFRDRAESLAGEIACDLPDYTVHDITHLDALWKLASLITGPNFPLTPTEAFVLGGAFLIHDLGMGLAAYPNGIEDLKKEPHWNDVVTSLLKEKLGRLPSKEELIDPDVEIQKQATDQVLRDLHAKHAERLALTGWHDREEDTQYHLIEDPEFRKLYGPIIGKIAHSHWWSVDKLRQEFQTKLGAPAGLPSEWVVDPLKLACILRVSDASHLDALRAPGFLRALRKPTGDSKNHWIFQEKLNQPMLEADRLVYTSGSPFPIEDASSWWFCFDALRSADRELREVDALLADADRPRLAARGVAGVEEPGRLITFIATKDWLPIDTRIKVSNVASLIRNLGGEQLYGNDKTVPLRELIQNALDAVRARRLIEGRSNDWGGVIVRQGRDSDEYWIEVEDNGIGMSADVLKGPFLDFGISFWDSELMYEEFPGLSAKGFQSTGKYGIGFFSVFMWGKRVRIITRRHDAAQRDTYVLEFSSGVDSRALLRKAQDEEVLRDGGTRVRVWLKEFPKNPMPYGYLNLPWKLQDICTYLCPSIDVDLYVEIEGEERKKVISALDWISMDGEDLLKRTGILDPDDEIFVYYAEALSNNLRILKNSTGELVGRACISETRSFNNGVVTVGGLRACTLRGISGILVGMPTMAARNEAEPVIECDELGSWASEQADLVQKIFDKPEELEYCSKVIMACFGKTGNLPIVFSSNGWKSVQDISNWHNPPNEILLSIYTPDILEYRDFDTLILYDHVLATSVGIPIISKSFWSHQLECQIKHGLQDVRYRVHIGAVVEALSNAWSVPLEEVLRVSDLSKGEKSKREIGLGGGKPIMENVVIIRKPKSIQSKLP